MGLLIIMVSDAHCSRGLAVLPEPNLDAAPQMRDQGDDVVVTHRTNK